MFDLLWSELVGGFVGTLVLTTLVRSASELGVTRMDLALLLGTMVSDNRRRAKAIGYAFHFVLGLGFGIVYGTFFRTVGQSAWWLGALVGIVHACFIGTVLVNVLLPAVHPRLGSFETGANSVALIEPPGFLLLNYGRATFAVNLVAHAAYGAIVAWTVGGHIK
jgi:hypothetical protein